MNYERSSKRVMARHLPWSLSKRWGDAPLRVRVSVRWWIPSSSSSGAIKLITNLHSSCSQSEPSWPATSAGSGARPGLMGRTAPRGKGQRRWCSPTLGQCEWRTKSRGRPHTLLISADKPHCEGTLVNNNYGVIKPLATTKRWCFSKLHTETLIWKCVTWIWMDRIHN